MFGNPLSPLAINPFCCPVPPNSNLPSQSIGNFLVAVFITPKNFSPICIKASAVATDAKYESALVLPWANSGRLVRADSYFVSVATADALMQIGLKFFGVIMTATRKFPMDWLDRFEFGGP
jgi:hypothetical protein